jgi:hypothetical protein
MEKRMGRPPKPPDEQLSEIVPVRLTPAERQACEKASERAGMKPTAWMRDRLKKAAKRESK